MAEFEQVNPQWVEVSIILIGNDVYQDNCN